MTVLLVSPFAPYRDGIAAYAAQELRRLRDGGERVDVCSPVPSAARWHLPLGGPAGMARLVALAANYDRVLVQFGPELAFGRCRSAAQRVAVWAALAALARRRPLELRIHEVEYGPLDQNPLERRAAALALRAAARVTVHTEAERGELARRLGSGLAGRIALVDHGQTFQPAIRIDRTEARARLGLPAEGYRFVAIGFLQRHKGFDRAVEAVDRLSGDVHLHVVGSARVDHPEIAAYVEQLRGRCGQVANATLHEGYVSDVEFDLWLQAADAVVLPYREIWSSGVLERAGLFDRPVVAADLAQLRDQAPPDTLFFTDVDELTAMMDKLCSAARTVGPPTGGVPVGSVGRPRWDVDPNRPDREGLQRQIEARARSSGGSSRARSSASRLDDRNGGHRAAEPLLAVGSLRRPEATSARPGVAPLKRMVDRLTAWRVDPLADHVEALQRAATEAVVRLEEAAGRADGPIEVDLDAAVRPPREESL